LGDRQAFSESVAPEPQSCWFHIVQREPLGSLFTYRGDVNQDGLPNERTKFHESHFFTAVYWSFWSPGRRRSSMAAVKPTRPSKVRTLLPPTAATVPRNDSLGDSSTHKTSFVAPPLALYRSPHRDSVKRPTGLSMGRATHC